MRISQHSLLDDEVEALIFDVDGTLIDSMPLFFLSWVTACKQHGLEFTEHQFYAYAGRPLPDIVADLVSSQHGSPPTDEFVANFIKIKRAAHAEVIEKHGHPTPIECVVKIAHEMKTKGIKLAAASSGLREHVFEHLKVAGLIELFDEGNIVVASDLPPGRGKPCPDIFLEAARRLGVDPKKCRAFEDGESGLESALKAGMEVFDVREIEGYPLSEALKEHLPKFKESRTWLTQNQ